MSPTKSATGDLALVESPAGAYTTERFPVPGIEVPSSDGGVAALRRAGRRTMREED